MQIEEMRREWRQLDEKLDRSLVLATLMSRMSVLRPAERRLQRMAVWPFIDLAACAGGLLLVGSHLGDHFGESRLALPAVVLMVGLAALLGSSVRQLMLLSSLDWSGPVAEIQGRLRELRNLRIQQFRWVILLAPLAGFCGLVIGLHNLSSEVLEGRAGLLDWLDGRWVAANLVFGVLFAPLGYFASRELAKRYRGRRWWESVLADLSGRSLEKAVQEVERWASLEGSAPARPDRGG